MNRLHVEERHLALATRGEHRRGHGDRNSAAISGPVTMIWQTWNGGRVMRRQRSNSTLFLTSFL